ncbi:MAG: HRDC domain-containing protein [Anaerolineae bacterium]|nr:HRDC domain-containing protein [Anaerolineae bacterium]
MALNGLPPAAYIDDDHRLQSLVPLLAREPLLAIDTESNSLHAYRERVCLIQISTREADFIVDPLTIGDLSPLGPIFADPKIEKVFHAAEYDLMCLKRDFNFSISNLFDTMVAARVSSYRAVGLGALLTEFLGIHVDKSHQRDDWGQRPLAASSLRYAQMDTHYLPVLRDYLKARLEEMDRTPEAYELFDELCGVRTANNHFNPEGYWRLALPNNLTMRQAAILRELYLWRDGLAERRDVPPFKVLSDKTLIALARHAPETTKDLSSIHGMSDGNIRRFGRDVLRLIVDGNEAPLPEPPEPEPAADPRIVELYTVLREWRRDRANEREVESDVIVSRDALWAMAEHMPQTYDELRDLSVLGPWRLKTYGDELVEIIQRHAPKKHRQRHKAHSEDTTTHN